MPGRIVGHPPMLPARCGYLKWANGLHHSCCTPVLPNIEMHDVPLSEVYARMVPLDRLLKYAVDNGVSDVHLKVGAPPSMRVNGELQHIPGAPRLKPEDIDGIVLALTNNLPKRREEFAEHGETDLAYSVAGLGRFRVNVFRQRGSASVVMRYVPGDVPMLEDLGLPPVVQRLAEEDRGIVLVTGTTGSGKSTTLAAMINHINHTMSRHVVTIEDPIEFLHRDVKSIINQREIGVDTATFQSALRRLLRQDPDAIMIGEIRDAETMETALHAAETGHLVFSTLHTLNSTETINRIIGLFPPHMQQQTRAMLAGTLKGIISQRLVPKADGSGRAPALEVLVVTNRARDMILDPAETGRIEEVVKDGEYDGMQTFDQALFGLVTSGQVSLDEAMRAATSRHDFKLMLEAGSARRTAEQFEDTLKVA
jgi:twitching motility protein PilT